MTIKDYRTAETGSLAERGGTVAVHVARRGLFSREALVHGLLDLFGVDAVRGLCEAAAPEHLVDLLVPLHDADLAQRAAIRRKVVDPQGNPRRRVQVPTFLEQPLAFVHRIR